MEISLDDFGTGYSSLSCLQPADRRRQVDRSFVHDVTAAAHDVSVTRSIITMARPADARAGRGWDREPARAADRQPCDICRASGSARRCRRPVRNRCCAPTNPALPERFLTRSRRPLCAAGGRQVNILAAAALLRRDSYPSLTAGSAAEASAAGRRRRRRHRLRPAHARLRRGQFLHRARTCTRDGCASCCRATPSCSPSSAPSATEGAITAASSPSPGTTSGCAYVAEAFHRRPWPTDQRLSRASWSRPTANSRR